MKERIFLWGTGGAAHKIMDMMGDEIIRDYNVLGFIDNSLNSTNALFRGIPVYNPDYLYGKEFERIVILINECADEVRSQIADMFGNNVSVCNKFYFMKKRIMDRYKDTEDDEIRSILNYIKLNDLDVFCYDYVKEYDNVNVVPIWDEINCMYYVIHAGKRMYFSRKYNSENKVISYYKSLLIEQDSRSPHKYIEDNFVVEDGSVVVDAGVAEANFSVEIIDRVKKIYMFEADEEWIEAIKLTFSDYMDKVVIINKFLSDKTLEHTITLDDAIDEQVDFIKMDIEGYETKALNGAKKILDNNNVRIAVCTYHRDEDENAIVEKLKRYGFCCMPSLGYMWYPYGDNNYSSKLNRGVLRCEKI